MDALREKELSERLTPAPASWEAVGRRVRRGAALRRAGLTAGALAPIVALLLWAPWHRPAQPAAPTLVAQTGTPPAPTDQPAVIAGPPVVIQSDPSIVILSDSEESPAPLLADATPAVDPFAALPDDAPRHRPRLSVGFRAGSGARVDIGEPASQAYASQTLMVANYLNTLDPASPEYANSGSLASSVPADAPPSYYASVFEQYASRSLVSRYHHDMPVTLGLSVRMALTPRAGLESGLEYTYLHSVEELGKQTLDQRLHLVGIPLRADLRLGSAGHFDFYLGLGGKVEKCVSATLGRVSCDEPRLLWSAGAFAGIQYRLGRHASLYFQPDLSYYFTQTELVTYRTENPLSVSLHAGLRWDL